MGIRNPPARFGDFPAVESHTRHPDPAGLESFGLYRTRLASYIFFMRTASSA